MAGKKLYMPSRIVLQSKCPSGHMLPSSNFPTPMTSVASMHVQTGLSETCK